MRCVCSVRATREHTGKQGVFLPKLKDMNSWQQLNLMGTAAGERTPSVFGKRASGLSTPVPVPVDLILSVEFVPIIHYWLRMAGIAIRDANMEAIHAFLVRSFFDKGTREYSRFNHSIKYSQRYSMDPKDLKPVIKHPVA